MVAHEALALVGLLFVVVELHALRELSAGADALAALLGEGAALRVEAQLRLLERAEQDAAELAAAARRAATEPARAAAERRPA